MTVLCGARVFDGDRLLDGHVVVLKDDQIAALCADDPTLPGPRLWLDGGILAPGLIDLQVNGGDGEMVGAATDQPALGRLCATHIRLGCAGILPTLITDTPEVTARVIAAGIAAAQAATPGFLGLHIEGPHLDPRRAGAHDPALIRAMTPDDLAQLCDAARHLPALMVTLAPESATPDQIAGLTAAGVVVSLGHSDCSHATAQAALAAGARCITHLFNAMSQLGNREPGLVGAALDSPVAAGIIADGLHISPATLRIALAAKPQGLFLVSDSMAFAGTDRQELMLQGRVVRRAGGRLTLPDGTLAGADLTLPQAIKTLVQTAGVSPERALRMATSVPAGVIGAKAGLIPGQAAHLVHLDADWRLAAVWHGGVRVV